MSGESGNQLDFIFPSSVYNYLNTGEGEIPVEESDLLVKNINKFDTCNKDTLKGFLKSLVTDGETPISDEKINEIECVSIDLKNKIKDKKFKSYAEIDEWCKEQFVQDFTWLHDMGSSILKSLQNMNLKGAYTLNEYFNFIDEVGNPVNLSDAVHLYLPPSTSPMEGGARSSSNGKMLRLNLLKNGTVPVLFTALSPYTDYLTKKWRNQIATYPSSSSSSSSTSSNPADCSPDFNSGLDKRHIKPWTPRDHGSSAGTVNAMSHLRRMATQPRITQVELGSLGPLLARGFMGGSMDGGAQLDVDFTDCPSENKKGDKLSVRQSEQYANLFKSVVQRLDKHNTVSETVVNELKTDLEEYRRKECKLFQDAFRLANALKSQNNGSLPDKQPITSLDAFKEASDEVAKSETHLLGCLTKILTETCKKP
jgi:hypothetical protein